MHLPQSLLPDAGIVPGGFPEGLLSVPGQGAAHGFPCLSRCRVVFRRRRSAQGHFASPSASFRELDDVRIAAIQDPL